MTMRFEASSGVKLGKADKIKLKWPSEEDDDDIASSGKTSTLKITLISLRGIC